MKYHADILGEKIVWLGKEIFGSETVTDSIEAFENLFIKLDCPVRLSEAGIPESKKDEIIALMIRNEVSGMNIKLDKKAIEEIVKLI